MTNSVFWQNELEFNYSFNSWYGSALYFESVDNSCLTNCTIVGNVGYQDGGAVYYDSCTGGTIQNCIIAHNDSDQLGGSGFTLTHCCVYPENYPGVAVLDVEPGFPEGWEDSGDLHLAAGSPCIDYGNNFVDTDPAEPGPQYLPLFDLDGLPRFFDGNDDGEATVDLGAYEYQGGDLGG